MSRLAILNMIIGFLAIFVAALGGFFVSFSTTEAYLHNPSDLGSWELTLLGSAHGHTNLFGMLHILFGLTMPYSTQSPAVKNAQTIGFVLGTCAMSGLMVLRSATMPTDQMVDALGALIGVCLMATTVALALHIYGLTLKLYRT